MAGMKPARYCASGKARAPVRSDKSLNKALTIYYNVFQPFRPAFFIRTED